MAIKGKKKSQSRGSQARRRPAAAPRPAYASGASVPWHRRPGAQVAIAVGVAVVFGLASWAFIAARSNAREADAQREQLDRFTSDLRGIVQQLDGPVGEMTAMPPEPAEGVVADLETAPGRWIDQLSEVDQAVLQVTPTDQTTNIHSLLSRTVALYTSAAETFRLDPSAEGALQARLLRRAADIRDQAAGIFFAAVSLLDAERIELDMGSSRLEPPGSAPPSPPVPAGTPSALTTVPVESQDEQSGGGGNGGKRSRDRGGN